ncbi:MAG: DUF1330 domain-containing protein [Burkholderiales bacterium]|nr:DUF1330 domain-containing protein [Burkholderiales bacterium]MDE2565720.1 DUF1330 domain-containing protein [Burkholderiales bacterium]
MAAYLYAELEVIDAEAYAEYRARVPAVIAAHGGRFLVRGGEMVVLEGPVASGRRVLLEFPDLAALRAFHADPAYAPLIALRQRAARGTLVALDGLPPDGA